MLTYVPKMSLIENAVSKSQYLFNAVDISLKLALLQPLRRFSASAVDAAKRMLFDGTFVQESSLDSCIELQAAC